MIDAFDRPLPTVAIICPVFNSDADQLTTALRSVLKNWPTSNVEIIVVNDGSNSDLTLAALTTLDKLDPRIHVVHLPRNRGPGAARYQGLLSTRAEWVGFIDADDQWRGIRTDVLYTALTLEPTANWVAGRYQVIKRNNLTVPQQSLAQLVSPDCMLSDRFFRFNGPQFQRKLIVNHTLHLGATLVKRDAILLHAKACMDIQIGEDTYLQARLASQHSLVYCSDIIYDQIDHSRRMTKSSRFLRFGDVELYRSMARDESFKSYRREIRWALYHARKDLGIYNAMSGFRARAIRCALSAYAMDPRELRDLWQTIRLTLFSKGQRDDALQAKGGPRDLRDRSGSVHDL